MNLPMSPSAGRRIGRAAIAAPRLVMSWEDWLTFSAALITFISIAVSIQQAHWVRGMPALVPTALGGLLIGMFAARIRTPAVFIHPVALTLGAVVVILSVQAYADGANFTERLTDFRLRMKEWFDVVRAGDISNDNLPFVTLVHSVCFFSAYLASWSLYRWRNAWIAVVPAAVVLLVNISFLKGQPSGPFIVFLFGAILLVGRVHLQRSQESWSRAKVDYPEFISLSAGQLTVMLTAVVIIFAWLVPLGTQADAVKSAADWVASPFSGNNNTLTRLFHNVTARTGANLHSFGDTLPIQSNVKLGTKTLFEVNSNEAGLIRGTSYDFYTGAGWKATGRKESSVNGKELAADQSATEYDSRNVTILKVKVFDSEGTILTAGTPLGTNVASTVERSKLFEGDIEQLRSSRSLNSDDTYNSFGTESIATANQLRLAGADYPDWVKNRYLQLPKSLPDRVREEAKRVASGIATPYDQAFAIEQFLRAFPYDLQVESAPPRRDTVDFLLFDLKRGYFDYQATAMAVMLRTLGIPARVAVGYVLNPDSADGMKYTVRKSDAYTWVEAFFPRYGWVNFNPTQDRPGGGAGGIGNGLVGGDTSIDEPPDLSGLFEDPNGLPNDVANALNETPVQNSAPPWTLIWSLAAALTVAAAAFLGGRLTWNWGLAGLEGRARLWAKTQRLASWAGLGAHAAETPREWSRRLGGAIEREDEASRIADAYEESRYGRPDLKRVDDATTGEAYLSVRNRLLAKVLRRKTPAKK